MNFKTPQGMNRRHFMRHLAGASAMTGTALALGNTLKASTNQLKKNKKAADPTLDGRRTVDHGHLGS